MPTSTNDDVLLDVGYGDGLVSFGALQASNTCKVVLADISLELQIAVNPKRPASERSCETLLEKAWNPQVPTASEVLNSALSPVERGSFISFMRPL
jgi:hypothetical protein